ncbi:uncharacterized protein [Amphiura filiformis]|uniref:uncharacterized protein n=1 Tax=Amphiura filiformis TaxID=82378 RepID=UPI003B20E1AB
MKRNDSKKAPPLNEYQFRVLQHYLRTGLGYTKQSKDKLQSFYRSTAWLKKTFLLIHASTSNGHTLYVKVIESNSQKWHCEYQLANLQEEMHDAINAKLKSLPRVDPAESIDVRIFLTYSPCYRCAKLLQDFTDFFCLQCNWEGGATVNQVFIHFVQVYNVEERRPFWYRNRAGLREIDSHPKITLQTTNWTQFEESFMIWVKTHQTHPQDQFSSVSNLNPSIRRLLKKAVSVRVVYKLLPEDCKSYQSAKADHISHQKKWLKSVLDGN